MMEATFRTTIDRFRKQTLEYGKRLTDEGIKKAAYDLSTRAENAVKRDFNNYFQGDSPTMGSSPGMKTTKAGHLRSQVHATIKNDSEFGVGVYDIPYGAVHEYGHDPYIIKPKANYSTYVKPGTGRYIHGQLIPNKPRQAVLKIPTAYGIRGKKRGIASQFMFVTHVHHPRVKARHWVSEPMMKELFAYIKDQIKKLEAPLK